MSRKPQGIMEAGEQGGLGLESRGATMMAAPQEAMDGTIANKVQQQHPKWEATPEYRKGWGHKRGAWCKRMNGACGALRKVKAMPDRGNRREAPCFPHPRVAGTIQTRTAAWCSARRWCGGAKPCAPAFQVRKVRAAPYK